MDSTNGISNSSTAQRVRVLFGFLRALILFVVITCVTVFFGAGKWLVREDPLQQATAIVVLSGNLPTRALEAAALYHEGYAREIWLTHPDVHADALKELAISYPSEDDFNTRVLRRAGVPAKAIHVLDTPIVNTAEELDVISSALKTKVATKSSLLPIKLTRAAYIFSGQNISVREA
jgi:DUF218 domain